MTEKFLQVLHVADRYGVSRATVYDWAAKSTSDFPKPIRLTGGTTRWRLSELEAWEQRRAKAPA